ncbi:MAG: proton-conducting transporter membrane subunit [Candidatus Omnitrophota bacterium]
MYSLFILAPLAAVIILNLPFRKTMKRAAFWCALTLLIMQIYLVLFPISDLKGLTSLLRFDFNIDFLSTVVLFCVGIVLLVTLLVGKSLIAGQEKLFNFTNLLLIILMGSNGVALVTDIFSLYVFIEITGVTSFILISFYKDRYALESTFKYIILSAVASVMMLFAIALFLLIAGDTSFSAINTALGNSPHSFLISLAAGVFICALFIKGGLMPFHSWLPDVYSAAPAPVSVLLAGIVTKVLGIYGLIRVAGSVLGFDGPLKNILLFIGALSIILGALAALGQNDFKKMLAYSSISQVGYIIMGLGCGTNLAIFGAVFHLFNHSIFKSALFVNSAAIELQTGTRNMNRMGGLASRMPITGVTSIISCLSAAGIPPLSGFWSKLIIVAALWISGYYLYAVIGIIASGITLAYFLSLQRKVFFGGIKDEFKHIKEAGFGLILPVLILTVITIGIGLVFPFLPGMPKF